MTSYCIIIQIQLFSASHVVFKNNSAKTGGAISVFTPVIYKDINMPLYYNKLCFIQYQIMISDRLAPEKWKVCTLLYAVMPDTRAILIRSSIVNGYT